MQTKNLTFKWGVLMILMILTSNFILAQKTYKYTTFPNDPTHLRLYTLDNGFKIYLSKNIDQPKIQTLFAVKTGSKNDPADATGLAHYLEHMLFKGTHKLGTKDWAHEKVALKKISDTYEILRKTKDKATRKQVYHQIDSLSGEAAKFAIPNEYDKLMTSLGAEGTNAFTSNERTVFVNEIPSAELEKFLKEESQRFQTLVLRLFHTELEAVYEEFNKGQDSDRRKVFYAMSKAMFKKHNYGLQSTIGLGEHLKNPSMEKIHTYFNEYYVPNNCALILSGDIDYDKTIAMIDQYYGSWKPGKVHQKTFPKEDPILQPEEITILGPDEENVSLGFRFDGYNSDDAIMLELIDLILANGQAGIIDLNLEQSQAVLSAGCYVRNLLDYSVHNFYGSPREGQSLEEVKDLLLQQIDKLKKGEFPDWLIAACIKSLKLDQIKTFEDRESTAYTIMNSFIMGESWDTYLHRIDRMSKITKQQIIDFANKHYKNNYVVIYKKTGEDPNVLRLEKPEITPVDVNRDDQSPYFTMIQNMPSSEIKPIFIDFEKSIHEEKLGNIPYYFTENKTNKLFSLDYIFDMGTKSSKELQLALSYLPYLGTSKYTAEQLQEEFFKNGLYFGAVAMNDRSYVYLSGLEESLDAGIQLFEHILSDVQKNKDAYVKFAKGVEKKRKDAKLNKRNILWRGLFPYGKYGALNPETDRFSMDAIKNMDLDKLTNWIHGLSDYEHIISYYGPDSELAKKTIQKYHKCNKSFKPVLKPTLYPELDIDKTEVFLVDYDMVQTQFIMLSKAGPSNRAILPDAELFNEYFGGGLSSIVFQEIRESKALAYTAFCSFDTPSKPDESNYVFGFVGTQTAKLPDALNALNELLNKMPYGKAQFESAKTAVKKQIASDRITKDDVFWEYLAAKDMGYKTDIRKEIYDKIDKISFDDLQSFFKKNIKGKPYRILVMGKKSEMDLDALKKMGPITELSLETLFGY